MVPGLVDGTSSWVAPGKVNKDIFPDGFKTSGQHEPLYSCIQPYDKFPKEITGPTAWKAEDYSGNPERWTHSFTEEEIAEIGGAADDFIQSGVPLTGITKVSGPGHVKGYALTKSGSLQTSQVGRLYGKASQATRRR